MSMESYTAKTQSAFPRKGLVKGVCARARAAVAAGPAQTAVQAEAQAGTQGNFQAAATVAVLVPAPEVSNPRHLHERLRLYMEKNSVSQTNVAQVLGLPVRRLNYYLTEKSEVNLWPLLPALLQADPRISREWLYFGEGSMWGTSQRGQNAPTLDRFPHRPFQADPRPSGMASLSSADAPLPLTWLVDSDEQGWFSKSSLSVNVSPPQCGKGWIAVLASGDALAPCGIRDGYTLFCDPGQQAAAGEIVYALRSDGSATIKVYQGRDSQQRIVLQGWLPVRGGTPESFLDTCAPEDLVCLAPLIYIKCRL